MVIVLLLFRSRSSEDHDHMCSTSSVRRVAETPTPTGLEEKYGSTPPSLYGSTPPICIAGPSWLLSLEERETQQYTSHLYCSTPPICTAVRLPFVRQYFWESTGGWGHRKVPENLRGNLGHGHRLFPFQQASPFTVHPMAG